MVTMMITPAELATVLDRLEHVEPHRRFNGKHAQLAEVRDRLMALHARGHSWRAIARELSASGEKVSADLLRAVCNVKKAKRRRKTAHAGSGAVDAARVSLAPRVPAERAAAANNDGRFGAKGLKP